MQEINFTGNLGEEAIIFFIIDGVKKTILSFSQGTVEILQISFALIYHQCKITQYNTLNVKFSNSELNKSNSGIKTNTEVTLNLSSNVVGNFNNESYFPHTFLLNDTQVLRLYKTFVNNK